MVTPLLDTGRVDVNSVDKDGQTPLSYATSDEVRELLRRYGAHN